MWSALGELLPCSAGRTVTMLHVQNGAIEKIQRFLSVNRTLHSMR